MPEAPLELEKALNQTVEQQPEVMPTASILREEAQNVNAAPEKSSLDNQKKKRGRPSKADLANRETSAQGGKLGGFVGGAGKPDNSKELAQRVELASQCITLVEQSGSILAGNAAKMPETEKLALTANLDNYLASKNINDIPPGLLLTIGLGMYYGRVLRTEDENKVPIFVKIIYWAKSKFRRKDARFDNRNDGKRENNTGETTSKKV